MNEYVVKSITTINDKVEIRGGSFAIFVQAFTIAGGIAQIYTGTLLIPIGFSPLGYTLIGMGVNNVYEGISMNKSWLRNQIGTVPYELLNIGTGLAGLTRSVGKISSLGTRYRALYRKDPIYFEPAFHQMGTVELTSEVLNASPSVMNLIEQQYYNELQGCSRDDE